MIEKHRNLLSDFEFRMHQLMYLCDSLKEENLNLKFELAQKEEEISEVQIQLRQLKIKYNNLVSANSLSGNSMEDIEQTRKRLFKLVQEVEKCISLLKL